MRISDWSSDVCSSDLRAGRDAAQLFNYITGYVEPERLEMVTISPLNMRNSICNLIDTEIAAARAGRPSGVWAKMTSLVDHAIIDKLNKETRAGGPGELVVQPGRGSWRGRGCQYGEK